MFSPELARSLLSLPFLSLLCSSLLSFLLSFLFLLLCFYLPSYLLLRCCLHCFSWLADSLIHFYSKKNYFSLLSKTHKYIGEHDSAILMNEVVFTVTISTYIKEEKVQEPQKPQNFLIIQSGERERE